MSSAVCFNLDQSKILSSGNGLTLPNDKILDWTKLKPFEDVKINDSKIKICFGKGRKNFGKKEEILVTSIFSSSYNVFKNLLFPGLLKVRIVW